MSAPNFDYLKALPDRTLTQTEVGILVDAINGLAQTVHDYREQLPLGPRGTVRLVFHWDPSKGDCYDCGRPAAYELEGFIYCSVCFATQANTAHGVGTYLFEDPHA